MNFIKESIEEMRKVTWPTRNQALKLTAISIIFTIVATLALVVFDKTFRIGYNALLETSTKVENEQAIQPEVDAEVPTGGIEAYDEDGNPVNLDVQFDQPGTEDTSEDVVN